jgi:hypothetical protein
MKNTRNVLMLLFAAVLMIAACTKTGQFNAPAGQIAIGKTSLKIGEPDTAVLVGADSTQAVHWSFNPAGNDTITYTFKNFIRFTFSKAGTYTISANQAATNAKVTVKVIDSIYVPTPYVTPLNPGEQLTIVPKYIKATATDSAHLAFTLTTKTSYCGNTHMDFSAFVDNSGTFYMGVDDVTHPYDCTTTFNPLSYYADIRYIYNTIAIGHHAIVFSFNHAPIYGSFDVTATSITFNWDNTSGVIISPAVVSR